nr:MFS transporter [Marinobacter panjinensis]
MSRFSISDLVFWQADGLAMILTGRVLSGLSAGIFTGTATVAVIELAPPHWREKAAVTSTFFVVAYIAISVPVIGLGLMASITSLKTTGITFAAVMGSLAALALVLLIRRERAGENRSVPDYR